MRTRKLLLAALWLSFPAFAQSAQSVCGGLLMGEERVRCMPDQTLEICIEIPDGFRLH